MLQRIILWGIALWFTFTVEAAEKGEMIVWKVDIKSEIGPEIWRLVRKSFDESEKQQAESQEEAKEE